MNPIDKKVMDDFSSPKKLNIALKGAKSVSSGLIGPYLFSEYKLWHTCNLVCLSHTQTLSLTHDEDTESQKSLNSLGGASVGEKKHCS